MTGRYLSRRTALREAAMIAAGFAALACATTNNRAGSRGETQFESPIGGGILNLSATGVPEHLDPHASISPLTQRLAAYSYNRLFKSRSGQGVNANYFDVTEDLAESSESLPDFTSHVVHLRGDARFVGRTGFTRRPVTAQDVVMSFERYGALAGKDLSQLRVVERMTPVDDRTVRFDLKRPAASFLQTLASPVGLWVLPVSEVMDGTIDPDRATGATASGPFVLESIDAERITVRRNSDYFLPDLPFLEGINIEFEREYVRSKIRFRDGSIDVLRPFPIDVPDLRQFDPGVRVFGDIALGMNAILLDGRMFTDVRVRRAISMAIERSALVDTYANVSQLRGIGAEERFHNVGVPASFAHWWLDPTGPKMGDASHWYEFSPKESIALLLAAGITPGTEVAFRYQATGSAGAFSSTGQSIALMLNEIGLQTRMHREDPRSNPFLHPSSTRPDGITFAAGTPHTDIDDWLHTMLHSSGLRNQAIAPDKQLDKLIEGQQATPNFEARRSLLHEIQRYASDRMYVVPTAAGTAWTAVRPRVRNFEFYQANSGSYGQAAEQWQWLHLNG